MHSILGLLPQCHPEKGELGGGDGVYVLCGFTAQHTLQAMHM